MPSLDLKVQSLSTKVIGSNEKNCVVNKWLMSLTKYWNNKKYRTLIDLQIADYHFNDRAASLVFNQMLLEGIISTNDMILIPH